MTNLKFGLHKFNRYDNSIYCKENSYTRFLCVMGKPGYSLVSRVDGAFHDPGSERDGSTGVTNRDTTQNNKVRTQGIKTRDGEDSRRGRYMSQLQCYTQHADATIHISFTTVYAIVAFCHCRIVIKQSNWISSNHQLSISLRCALYKSNDNRLPC